MGKGKNGQLVLDTGGMGVARDRRMRRGSLDVAWRCLGAPVGVRACAETAQRRALLLFRLGVFVWHIHIADPSQWTRESRSLLRIANLARRRTACSCRFGEQARPLILWNDFFIN